ncbi:hypothetical protein AMTRI_Chr09g13490 [Amborella trichopoda]|uniref:Myb-like domain-containing protein n=1 Tax=Amborella trichopoda TaxID=13333 RepID=U5D3P1_AMBTC|nr:trihelix transcription factor ASR3 [Amborella trichopoda]ERN17034.1 hypothetical protein AMTR_s00044p00016810 [Amborella trichopoda]|eukprot:XP_020529945.1 trihelix transcription factor ASR3 [Amborella trichopoda]
MGDPNTAVVVAQEQSGPSSSSPNAPREYRKGNWTLHETMVLIRAKRMDDERRMKGGDRERNKTAELRWKWVENYCWQNDCLRSQNQCNDKWDNLLRDYKKVRDYEARRAEEPGGGAPSYWQIEKQERKEKNLPSNMVAEVFEALNEVVNKRCNPNVQRALPPIQQQLPPPPPPPAPPPPPPPSQPFSGDIYESSDSDHTEKTDSEAKRRKLKNLGPSVVRSASMLAQTMLTCEEKREKRHRDIIEIEEKKLQMEERRTEMNRQGFSGLVSSVNNLSNAILALVSNRNDGK